MFACLCVSNGLSRPVTLEGVNAPTFISVLHALASIRASCTIMPTGLLRHCRVLKDQYWVVRAIVGFLCCQLLKQLHCRVDNLGLSGQRPVLR